MIVKDNVNVKEKKRVTCIIGDSMVKQIKGWEMNKRLDEDFVVVKTFSGAKSTCMEHYIAPPLEQKPENIVLHVGTNDLNGTDTASKIVRRIVNIAVKCSKNSKVFVSGIIKRGII